MVRLVVWSIKNEKGHCIPDKDVFVTYDTNGDVNSVFIPQGSKNLYKNIKSPELESKSCQNCDNSFGIDFDTSICTKSGTCKDYSKWEPKKRR